MRSQRGVIAAAQQAHTRQQIHAVGNTCMASSPGAPGRRRIPQALLCARTAFWGPRCRSGSSQQHAASCAPHTCPPGSGQPTREMLHGEYADRLVQPRVGMPCHHASQKRVKQQPADRKQVWQGRERLPVMYRSLGGFVDAVSRAQLAPQAMSLCVYKNKFIWPGGPDSASGLAKALQMPTGVAQLALGLHHAAPCL